MAVRILDTTFRDGAQSLWAMAIRHGMMEPVAADMDNAGFAVIEVPANAIHFKKYIRDLKENPFDLMRMLARKMPKTPKAAMGGGLNLNLFGTPTPPALGKLFQKTLFDIGVLNRIQTTCNTGDQLTRQLPTLAPFLKGIGYKLALAISYSISPRHTDEHYVEKTRGAAALKPDTIYLKDQGGLLTVDRLRTLMPIIMKEAGAIPVELHSHCTTGLAPLVYAEALKLGVKTLHCGIPPLADGPAQPSVLDVIRNARLLGYSIDLDEKLLQSVSRRLYAIARQDNMPLGAPTRYDYAQYIHQIPGGVISNLRFQLSEIGLAHRLDEVIQECIQIRQDLGYPIMITPFSQFVGTQAAINVATGKRYNVVIDELIRFAQGVFGEDSGYTWMDQNLKDNWLALPRAKELAALGKRPIEDISLAQCRQKFGAPGISDEELMMRAIMGGAKEIEALVAAGPPRRYLTSDMPLVMLLNELQKHKNIRYIQIQRGNDSISLHNRGGAAAASGAE
jgi:oxaloacetate decarboxylase (Na+ extruding) subunit alpha